MIVIIERRLRTGRSTQTSTHLGLAHALAAGPDPDDEDELLARGLLVVRVLHTRVRERRLPVVQLLAQLREAPRSGRRQLELV